MICGMKKMEDTLRLEEGGGNCHVIGGRKSKVTNGISADSMNVGWAENSNNRKRGFGIILKHLGKGESNHDGLR